MQRRRNYPIADDGWTFFIPVLVAAILLLIFLPFLGFILIILAGFIAYFFRNPIRIVPPEPDIYVAPADGKVLYITKGEDPEIGQTLTIGIFLSIFNVHITKSPLNGTIKKVEYHPGKFLNALNEKSSDENEHNIVTIAEENGMTVKVKQIAGIIARRIVNFTKEGEKVTKGQEIGLIRFGSRVELILPAENVKVLVKPSDKIQGGQTPVIQIGSDA